MATKLKNMRLTSVDLVRAGANQEADICLFKSADPQEATDSPTVAEKNIFKRFRDWFCENHQEAESEPETGIEKADEEPEASDIFKSAIIESLQSIVADDSLSADEKNSMIEKSVGQYHDKMLELAKSEDSESYDYFFEDLEKANPYHAADGKFTTASGGGAGGGGSGTSHRPFQSGNAHAVLSEMPKGSTVTIRTDKRETVYTKKDNGSAKGVVWGYSNSNGQFGNMSQGNLGDIINSGGNRVFGKINDVWTGKIGKSDHFDEIEEI